MNRHRFGISGAANPTREGIARSFQTALGISKGETFAVGDFSNDCPMFYEAGLSIAFNGNEQAKAAATISVESDDLSDILPIIYGSVKNSKTRTTADRFLRFGHLDGCEQ